MSPTDLNRLAPPGQTTLLLPPTITICFSRPNGFRLVLLWIHASWMSGLTSDELFISSWHLLNFSIFYEPPLADKVGEFFDHALTSRYRRYQRNKQAASRHITQSHHCSVMFKHCNDKKADAQTRNHRTKNQKQPESLHVNKTCLFQ